MALSTDIRPSFRISFMTEGDGLIRTMEMGDTEERHPSDSVHDLGLTLEHLCDEGRQTWRVCIRPSRATRILSVSARLAGWNMPSADSLYLNGYNSWTDSVERPVDDRMRGLLGVPRSVVAKWGLDGSGDYRFTAYDGLPGHQHGFGYAYLRCADTVALLGSLDDDLGMTCIRQLLEEDALLLDKEPPAHILAAGERRELMAIGVYRGTLNDACRSWLADAGVSARAARPLVGYTSWYRHYQDIDQDKMASDMAEAAEVLSRQDLEGCDAIFQIDDGYARIGDWAHPDTQRFPDGMQAVATAIRDAGLLPGLWMAPFVCERDSRLFAEHPDWLLHDDQGQAVYCGSNWSGYYALDTRHDAVREHVRSSLVRATSAWGFALLKLDFLFAACMLPHDGLNRAELMVDALGLIRESVGEDVRLDLCGVPLMAAMGRTEYCRIGCDVGLDWDDKPYMHMLHRERVSTRRSLANTRGRAHLDGLAFRNDPDVFFLRRDVDLTDTQREELLDADASLGGMLLTSDAMGSWDRVQREAFERARARFVARATRRA